MSFPLLDAAAPVDLALAIEHEAARLPLVVFTHLRWHGLFGRLQQMLTRLARHYRVHVVEEPVTTHEDAWLECKAAAPGIEVLVPHTRLSTATAPGFHDDQLPTVQALLADFARERGLAQPFLWLTTPMAIPLVAAFAPRAVIYDCMDELSLRPGAPHQLAQREAALLKEADVVITAGPSLYHARRGRHANVHCVPDAVEAEHFAPPAAGLAGSGIEAISARSIHAAIPGPRLGWFGAIDERLDLRLIAALADARPDWHIVLAGRLAAGIEPGALPRRPNLHWIGPQTHAILPHLLAHWDVCLLPLKCDASTQHANPPQTLEYLAGQKPVVSTPVRDVCALYGHIVRLAGDAGAFVDACRAALCERGPLRRQRRIDALIAVHSCTWERAVERVRRLMIEFAREPAGAPLELARVAVPGQALRAAAGARLTRA
jgi:glycosyltransferase involved in cell wall biosynthesis